MKQLLKKIPYALKLKKKIAVNPYLNSFPGKWYRAMIGNDFISETVIRQKAAAFGKLGSIDVAGALFQPGREKDSKQIFIRG